MSTVNAILQTKGSSVVTVSPEETVESCVRLMHLRRIGAVLVLDQERVCGIFSERDLARGVAEVGPDCLDKPVSTLMTRQVFACMPQDTIGEVMGQMTDRRIRHLPVVQDETLIGIVSIGDVVKSRIAEVEFEREALKQYIATG